MGIDVGACVCNFLAYISDIRAHFLFDCHLFMERPCFRWVLCWSLLFASGHLGSIENNVNV